MGRQLFANNIKTKIAAPVAPGDTSIALISGGSTGMPALSGGDWFLATLVKADGTADEIVMVTGLSTDNLTVVRAQEGTTAGTFAVNDLVYLFCTADTMKAILDALDLKAPLLSPALTGTPTAPTASPGTNTTQIATTEFVQAAVQAAVAGLSWKQAVRVATTTNGTLSTAFANGQTVDGVTLVTGDRILLKNQSTQHENGIYVVAVSGAPTRATDSDDPSDFPNAAVYVEEGTANADTLWVCTNNAPVTVGSTNIVFTQFASGLATTLDGLSDVVITSPSNGQALVYDSGSGHWINGGSAGPTRATVTKTTGSLASGSIENGTVTLAKWGEIGSVTVDRDCWIRLYATSADRTADNGRTLGTPASPTTNILAEWSFQSGIAGAHTQSLSRLSVGYRNEDGTPVTSIYYAIANQDGGTSTVQVQFEHLALET